MRTFLKSLWIALAFVGLVYFRFVHDLQGLSNKSSSLPMRNGQFPPHPNPSLLPSNITSQTIPTLKKNHSQTPKVAWLISYPNSGTSYTIMNVKTMTKQAFGSNYANNGGDKAPIWADHHAITGPWSRQPWLPLPNTYILVKTHCGGYCDNCPPEGFLLSNESFVTHCATTSTSAAGKPRVNAVYNYTIVEKAVHLIRNPFDNLLSRIHLARNSGKGLPNDDAEAYKEWCSRIDRMYPEAYHNSSLFDPSIQELFAELPCFSEWFRYVTFHNHVVQMLSTMKIPSRNLYYEQYFGAEYNQTVSNLLDFLELKPVARPLVFKEHSYAHLFSEPEARAALALVQAIASHACWDLLKHYFATWLPK